MNIDFDAENTDNFIELKYNKYLYCIYINPKERVKLYLDVYENDDTYESEIPVYNGELPIKRTLFDYLRNRICDCRTWLYNVTINRKAFKTMRDKYDHK